MPRGVPNHPETAARAGRKAILEDPVEWGIHRVERRHLAWLAANGGIAGVRRLIDEAIRREAENGERPPRP